jgi:hypothetical protein
MVVGKRVPDISTILLKRAVFLDWWVSQQLL